MIPVAAAYREKSHGPNRLQMTTLLHLIQAWWESGSYLCGALFSKVFTGDTFLSFPANTFVDTIMPDKWKMSKVLVYTFSALCIFGFTDSLTAVSLL